MSTGYYILQDTGGSFNDPEQRAGLHGNKPGELEKTERVMNAARNGHIREISRKEFVEKMKELGFEDELKLETDERKKKREEAEEEASSEADSSSEEEEEKSMTKKETKALVKQAGQAGIVKKNDDGDYAFGERVFGSNVEDVVEEVHKDTDLQKELQEAVEKEED